MKQQLNCILLVDDDEPTNYLNKMILDRMNCARQVKIAQSGKEALEVLKKAYDAAPGTGDCQPDLIFLDINMPAMDGWEFLELFRMIANRGSQKTVLVMLTTSLNPEDEIRSSGIAEVTAFKNKPLSREMIEDIMGTYFRNSN